MCRNRWSFQPMIMMAFDAMPTTRTFCLTSCALATVCSSDSPSWIRPYAEVLQLHEERSGPVFDTLHAALVPNDSHALQTKLRSLNIAVVSTILRAGMLRCGKESATLRTPGRLKSGPPVAQSQAAGLQRFMAFAYAQVHMQGDNRRGAVEVVEDGIVMALIQEQEHVETDIGALAHALRPVLRLTDAEALQIVSRAVDRLLGRRQVLRVASGLQLRTATQSPLATDLDGLASAVADRVLVRDGQRLGVQEIEASRTVLESCLLARAWDLAAHYAGAATGFGADLAAVVRELVAREGGYQAHSNAPRTCRSACDLRSLSASREQSSGHLSEIGKSGLWPATGTVHPRRPFFSSSHCPRSCTWTPTL